MVIAASAFYVAWARWLRLRVWERLMNQATAVTIFAISLAFILTDRVHRTIVAVAGASAMVAAGRLLGFFGEGEALAAVDFKTIGLLLGMMILVALLEPTGFFEYLALRAGRLSHGDPLRLFILLGAVTSVLSMFLDNVTTVVVIAPVTLAIARVLEVDAVPLLVAEAMLSNVGGIATLIGDPPNILIGTAAHLSFNDFLTHSLPIIAVVWVVALLLLVFLFRRPLAVRPKAAALDALHPSEALKQPRVAVTVLAVLAVAVILFLLQDLLEISPAFIAMGAAAVGLVLVRPNVHKTLEHVEWSVLIFFAALFVMVGGLEATGVLEALADRLGAADGVHPILLGVGLIWVVALLSAVVDNIPITIALIPVIAGLESSGVNVEPLWWALAFGAGLGGNATIIGSTANIVVAGHAERAGTPLSSPAWMRIGFPMLFVTCSVASLLYAALYSVLLSR